MDLNKVMLIGRLTRDPELRTTPQGTNVASFSVATKLMWNDNNGTRQEKTEFHNIVAWRKLGDICGQYLRKGMQVYIEGRLQTRSWDDQSGNKRYRTEVVADNMIMLGSKASNTAAPSGEPSYQATPEPAAPTGAEEEVNVEEIPF